uniref:SFRICE_001045 n=1 Tax=Spodoptera frugiperda TaxID=7108 RepID=A0A2H1VCG0_SPOFR
MSSPALVEFVIAALVAVAAGARLEHLERAYLPPFQGGVGGQGVQGSFGGNSGFGGAGNGLESNVGSGFPGATSNQYLPPDHGPSGANGFGAQNYQQQYNGFQAPQQYQPTSFGANYQGQYSQQSAATSRQYLAPNTGSYQNPPQQAFDEQTGYHY